VNKQQYKLVFAAACLGMLLFGIAMTTLGSILPEIIRKFGISKSHAGTLFVILNFGTLLGSLFFGPVVDRYGYQKLLTASTLVLLIGLEGIAFIPSIQWFTLFIFIFGYGGGIINGATNALVSDISSEGRSAGLALLGVFFGIGAFGVPLILGGLLNTFSYSHIIAFLGIIVVLTFIVFVIIRFPIPKQPHSFPVKETIALVKQPTLLLLAFILFFESGMEYMTGGWTAAFFNKVIHVNTSQAVILLSIFWIGMMLSRLILGKLLQTKSSERILKICIGIAFIGSLILLAVSNKIPATIGVFLLGAGFAATYPIILGYIGELYPKMSGTAFSLALTIALMGGMLIPYLAGLIGDSYGLRRSFLIIPAALISILILLFIVQRRFSQNKEENIKSKVSNLQS
jgi:fucose permease